MGASASIAASEAGLDNAEAVMARAREMTTEEREDHASKVLAEFIECDKQTATTTTDYSKSFSGTAKDTQVEKEAAELMRGNDEDDEPKIALSAEQVEELESLGKWMKFLGKAGCYLYVHSMTRALRSVRPEGFVDTDENVDTATNDDGLRRIDLTEVPAEIARIVAEEKKTPLVLDATDDRKVATFYKYKNGVVLDATALALPMRDKLRPKPKVFIEDARQKAVQALKTGSIFVLDLGDTEGSKAPLYTQWCKSDGLRKEIFHEAGMTLARNKMALNRMYKDDEKEYGEAIVRDGFATILITKLPPDEYEATLSDGCIDLTLCSPFIAVSS